MASDKPNGTFHAPGPGQVEAPVDVTDFMNHLHGDIVALATEHTAIFWGVSILIFERFFYYTYLVARWVAS